MQGFASQADFQDALGVFLGEFTGQKPGTKTVIQASVNVLSFGAGIASVGFSMPRTGTSDQPLSNEEAVRACRETMDALGRSGSFDSGFDSGFDWKSLPWAQILSIAMSFL